MKGFVHLVIADGFLRRGEKYNPNGFHATIDMFSGSSPLVYLFSACFAVALATLCDSEITDSSGIWVTTEWTGPDDFIEAVKLKANVRELDSAAQEFYLNLARNRRCP